MKKNETKVVCPVCGTEMMIPNNTEVVTGVALGKDSNLGTVYLTPANPCKHETKNNYTNQTSEKMKNKTAQERLDALKAKGVDVSSFFAVTNADGEGQIMKMDGGHLIPVDENDPVFLGIREGGYINNYTLFRRWVHSQMFHGLIYQGYRGQSGFTAWLKTKGYEYQWKTIVNELHAQSRMEDHGDTDNFDSRHIWFNKEVVLDMIDHYLQQLRKYVDNLKVKRCKGVPYKTIHGTHIFCEDIENKVFRPLVNVRTKIYRTPVNAHLLESYTRTFDKLRVRLTWDTPMCPAFVDAYKGCGAYYTLRSMIMFHGNRLSVDGGLHLLDRDASLDCLERHAIHFAGGEGYKLLGVLKEAIAYNHVDILGKILSWRRS